MGEKGLYCPGCFGKYNWKVPARHFDVTDLDSGDSYCRESGYVHFHEQEAIGQELVR